MLAATRGGFHMTFANGFTASVQWGPGNYCDTSERRKAHSPNAEVAFWKDDGNLIHREVLAEAPFLTDKDEWGDSVKGWLSPDEVVAFLAEVAAM